MAAPLEVLAPLVILHGIDEKHHYLYKGSLVAVDAYDPEQIKSLQAEGMLSGGKAESKKAEPAEPAEDEKPAGNASLADWQDYAKAHGKTDDDLDGLGRDAVRDLFA